MSTDYSAVCERCKVFWHVGQRMAIDTYSFGYGTGDVEGGARAMRLIAEHCEHGIVQVMVTDAVPESYEDACG